MAAIAGSAASSSGGPVAADDARGIELVAEAPTIESGAPIVVDPRNNIGIADYLTASAGWGIFDLSIPAETVHVKPIPTAIPPRWKGRDISRIAVDTRRQRLYIPSLPDVFDGASNGTCPQSGIELTVYDYSLEENGRRKPLERQTRGLPCTGAAVFDATASYYHETTDSVVMTGLPRTESVRVNPAFPAWTELLSQTKGSALLLRQMHLDPEDRFVLDWEVDLRRAGCGRWDAVSKFPVFTARTATDAFTICYDTDVFYGYGSAQAYLFRIPLTRDSATGVSRPETVGTGPVLDAEGRIVNYRFVRTPLLSGGLFARLDPVTGNVLLITADKVNGKAVWVYNPYEQRFMGVVTGGYAQEPTGNLGIGFDERRGRVYLLTQHGLLTVPVRQTPLPGGVLHPVMVNTRRSSNFTGVNSAHGLGVYPIAVFPTAGRGGVARLVFLGPPGYGPANRILVFDDHTPEAVVPEPPDLDRLTSTPDEIAGKETEVSASGKGIAAGARVVVTGGLARTMTGNDPACTGPPPGVPFPFPFPTEDVIFGDCLAHALATPGHREVLVASVEAEAGTSSGVVASATAQAFGKNDLASDGDVKALGDCEQRAFRVLTGNRAEPSDYERYADGCQQFQDGAHDGFDQLVDGVQDGGGPDLHGGIPDPRAGTAGADERGFPFRRVTCTDFGGMPSGSSSALAPGSLPEGIVDSTSVGCDQGNLVVTASARAGAVTLPDPADPVVAIARSWSTVQSKREAGLHVTEAVARAEGVRIGPLSIASVTSVATTRAGGQPSTASTEHVRSWCGIRVEGVGAPLEELPGCVDPDDESNAALVAELNQALARVWLRIVPTEREATRGGYQAVVTKDPDVKRADEAVNDDEAPTVPGLEVIAYNDGQEGRNRLIVQLAAVHAESRYGLRAVSDYGGFEFSEPEGTDEETDIWADDPGAGGGGGGSDVGGEQPASYEEAFGELIDAAPATARAFPMIGGRDRNPVQRLLRVPVVLLRDAINLLITNPREFALLFVLWSLLATPVYLGVRRRGFARAVAG